MIPRRLRPQRPAPATADAACEVCGAWMRTPPGTPVRDRAIAAGFFWADHQHEALEPIIDEIADVDWSETPWADVPRGMSVCEWVSS